MYPIIRKICAVLSYFYNERCGLRRLGEEILQSLSVNITRELIRIKTAYNKVLKVGEKYFDDYVEPRECLNVLKALKRFTIKLQEKLRNEVAL